MVKTNGINHLYIFVIVDFCYISYESVCKTVSFNGNRTIYQNRSIWFTWSSALLRVVLFKDCTH